MAAYPRHRGGDRWELRASAGRDEDGRQRFLYGTYRGGARGAKKAQADLVRRAAAAQGKATPKPATLKRALDRTFADAAEAWFEWSLSRFEPNGRDNVRQILDDYLLPKIGDVQLWRFRGEIALEPGDEPDELLVDLTAFYDELVRKGGKNGRALAASTVAQGPCRVVYGVFSYAVRRLWLETNPAATARRPVVPRRPSTTPQPDTLFPFFDWLADYDPELYAWAELMNSGARRVDMGVLWREWSPDVHGGEIVFGARGLILARPDGDEDLPPAQRGRPAKRIPMIRETPTGKRRLRRVALDPAANAALLAHRDRVREVARMCGLAGENPDGFIFSADPAGRFPRRPDWASAAFLAARRACGMKGLDNVRLYDVRHHHATQLLAAGIDASVLAERMGNSTGTIEKFYRHNAAAKDRSAAEAMAALRATTKRK